MTTRRVAGHLLRGALLVWLVAMLAPLVAIGLGRATGQQVAVVTTGSMRPTVPPDALTMVAPVAVADVEVGDVIAYRRSDDRAQIVLHRVVGVVERGTDRFFRTRGDANDTVDPAIVTDDAVTGRLVGAVPHAGRVLRWATEPWGPGLLVGVPLLLTGLERMVSGRDRRGGDATPCAVWTSRRPPASHPARP